jgi:hypothetical protein
MLFFSVCCMRSWLDIPAGPFGMVATSVIATPAIDAAAIRFPQRLVGVILGMSLAVVFTAREKGVDEMTDEADAIVVGSGINGLVASAELARAGWSVIPP